MCDCGETNVSFTRKRLPAEPDPGICMRMLGYKKTGKDNKDDNELWGDFSHHKVQCKKKGRITFSMSN